MPLSKYRISNFYKTVEVDGILEKDLLQNNWDLFEIKRPTTFFTVPYTFRKRPDLLSIKLYGKQDYWWILLKVNDIQDPWNDIHIGDIIQVPNVRDIEDFYAAVRLRRINNG